jgi:hypothetical protein
MHPESERPEAFESTMSLKFFSIDFDKNLSNCRWLIRCSLKMNTDYGLFQLFLATKSMRQHSERWLTTDKRSNESRLAEIDFSLLSRRIFVPTALQGPTALQMGLDLVLPPLVKS